MPFIWNDGLDIGVAQINEDHKNLIRIANDFLMACYDGHGSQAIVETMDELFVYTFYHFGREEALMAEHHYPALGEHHELHAVFIRWVTEMRDKVAGEEDKLSIDVLQFLEDWLVRHISIEDKKIARFLMEESTV